jgi:porin
MQSSAGRASTRIWHRLTATLLCAGSLCLSTPTRAEDAPGIWDRDRLLGDPGGLRSRLENAGITLQATETSAVWGNLSGGLKRGAVYDGLTQVVVRFDSEKLGLWQGGTLVASALQIHGRGPSLNLVGNTFHTVATFEATRSTRLYDLYYEQSLFDDRLSIRVGQFRADDEFIISEYGPETDAGLQLASGTSLFINSTFGFPGLAATNLPGGGPAYPMGALGVRVKVKPTEEISLLAAIFNGNPAGRGTGNPQLLNASGTRFPITDGYTAFFEAQYAINQAKDGPGLPGMYRVGVWFNNNSFEDPRYDTTGVSLASPASNGVPGPHYGNYSLYAGADQMVWQTGETKDQGIGVFARIMGSPNDRNTLSFYVNGGVTWKGMIPGRNQDTAGLGFGYAKVGARARGFDGDVAFYNPDTFSPVRGSEAVIEATYAFQLTNWWTLQPDMQYVIRPAGGVVNPNNPTRTIGNAFVLGLVTQITF